MRTTITVPDDTWRDFKVKSIREKRKLNDTVVKLINGFLAGEFEI